MPLHTPVSELLRAVPRNVASAVPGRAPDSPLHGLLRVGGAAAFVYFWAFAHKAASTLLDMDALLLPSFGLAMLARFYRGGWAHRDGATGSFVQPWREYETTDGAASGGWRGGLAECAREVVGVASDFARPLACVARAYGLTFRAAYEETLQACCVVGCYMINYGIISPMGYVSRISRAVLFSRLSTDSH